MENLEGNPPAGSFGEGPGAQLHDIEGLETDAQIEAANQPSRRYEDPEPSRQTSSAEIPLTGTYAELVRKQKAEDAKRNNANDDTGEVAA